MEYLGVEQARKEPGLRLVLSMGVPGPWGEAAKGILALKGIPFVPVGQKPAVPNPELDAWTGCTNAPVVMVEDERPRSGWAEILLLAERLAPEPRLIPEGPKARALMFGLAHEICGEEGFGWTRRLMLMHALVRPGVPEAAREMGEFMGRKYGLTAEAGESAGRRTAEILRLLSERLSGQRERGSRFFVGEALSAVDVYWATFAALLDPLPHEVCPMPKGIRASYLLMDPDVRKAADPILLEHRDFMYREFLTLPLDF
jgi:glutathione S-transferase